MQVIWALAITAAAGGLLATLRDGFHPMFKPPDAGFALPVVYAVWIAVVLPSTRCAAGSPP